MNHARRAIDKVSGKDFDRRVSRGFTGINSFARYRPIIPSVVFPSSAPTVSLLWQIDSSFYRPVQRVEKRDSKMPFVSRVGEKFRDQDFNYFIQPRAFFIQSSCAEPTRTLYKNLLHCASVTTSETHVSLETIAIRTAFTSKVSYRGAIERRDYRSNCVKRASLGPARFLRKNRHWNRRTSLETPLGIYLRYRHRIAATSKTHVPTIYSMRWDPRSVPTTGFRNRR